MANIVALMCSMMTATAEVHDIQGAIARVHQAQSDLAKQGTNIANYFSKLKADIDQWTTMQINNLYSSTEYKELSNFQLNDSGECERFMQKQQEFSKKILEIQMRASADRNRIEQQEKDQIAAHTQEEKELDKEAHMLQAAADITQNIAKSSEDALGKGLSEAFGVKLTGMS